MSELSGFNIPDPETLTNDELLRVLRSLDWNDPKQQRLIVKFCRILKEKNLLDEAYKSLVVSPQDPFRIPQ